MTPKAALTELATLYGRWRKNALGRAATLRKQGDVGDARFEEGRAHAFADAAMAVMSTADAVEEANTPSEAKQGLWEALNVGQDGSLDLTITCVGGEEWRICFVGERVIDGSGMSFAEAWANLEVTFDPAIDMDSSGSGLLTSIPRAGGA